MADVRNRADLILDAKARELYEAWIEDGGRRGWDWNPFSGRRIKPKEWPDLDNHSREVWRGKALAVLRSEETLADELKREERERRKLSPVAVSRSTEERDNG